MNDAWLVVIGSALTAAGSIIQQWITSSKDKREWEHRKASEETQWRRSLEKDEREKLREGYQNAIHHLSMLTAHGEPLAEERSEKSHYFELLQNAQKAVGFVCVRHPSPSIRSLVRDFVRNPSDYSQFLLEKIIELAEAEHLYSLNRSTINEPNLHERKLQLQIQFWVDEMYRKDTFEKEGKVLPRDAIIWVSPQELSRSQRALLMQCLEPQTGRLIRQMFWLPFPGNSTNQWEAKVDPDCPVTEILAAWEEDYLNSQMDTPASQGDEISK